MSHSMLFQTGENRQTPERPWKGRVSRAPQFKDTGIALGLRCPSDQRDLLSVSTDTAGGSRAHGSPAGCRNLYQHPVTDRSPSSLKRKSIDIIAPLAIISMVRVSLQTRIWSSLPQRAMGRLRNASTER